MMRDRNHGVLTSSSPAKGTKLSRRKQTSTSLCLDYSLSNLLSLRNRMGSAGRGTAGTLVLSDGADIRRSCMNVGTYEMPSYNYVSEDTVNRS